MKMVLSQRKTFSTVGIWKVVDANTHQCGNVRVVRRVDPRCKYRDDWRIQVRNRRGQWVDTHPVGRPWGYSGAGAAKRGAALMAAWQRGVKFR